MSNNDFFTDIYSSTVTPIHPPSMIDEAVEIVDDDKLKSKSSVEKFSIDKVEKDGLPRSYQNSFDIRSSLRNSVADKTTTVPNMWSRDYIGLYSQYAAVGLLYGANKTLTPFCVYTFDGESNVCSNARNIATFAWSMKIFFAILTDTYRPFGMRRKPWMIGGWIGVLVLLLILACAADQMSVSIWLVMNLFVQGFLMLSDVPADGYCVELGQLETEEQRGQILATGQRIRFSFCIVAGVIQTFLLNGPTTNDNDCVIGFAECWAWGLTINQYYALLFVMVFFLTIPVLYLKELDASHIPRHTVKHFFHEVWITMQNMTTFYLLIFVIGSHTFTNFTNNANIYLQYYVIKLTSFEAGIDTIVTYTALVIAIWIFQRYLIHQNWRISQYGSTVIASIVGLCWIFAYHNIGGTLDPWYTIFIDLDTNFAQGIAQVLYSMAVIELAKPGQEATTYELIVTVANSASLLNGILSTQLLTPMQAVGCDDDNGNCPSNTVTVTNKESFNASNGPDRFTYYTLLLTAISIIGCLIFTQFLPASKKECQDWKEKGEKLGTSERFAWTSFIIVLIIVGYGVIAAILLLDPETACEPAIGGSGC